MTGLPIEHRWEIEGSFWLHTATWIAEIPLKEGRGIEDTMAPVECVGEVFPWTLSALTRWGLERKMRRWEKRIGFVGERVAAP